MTSRKRTPPRTISIVEQHIIPLDERQRNQIIQELLHLLTETDHSHRE